MPNLHVVLRKAVFRDSPELEELVSRAARGLGRVDYTLEQIEAALGSAWGVDSQLIRDETYFVAETEGRIVAGGGWSKRATRFGGDGAVDRCPEHLDPALDAARIRAFFVAPDWARKGLGRQLLERCEQELTAAGFRRAELVATLTGVRLYQAFGYQAGTPFQYLLPQGMEIEFVPMRKDF